MIDNKLKPGFHYCWHITTVPCPTNPNEYMKYTGSHRGTVNDLYTHSSKVKEFCDIIPNSKSSLAERSEFFENMPEGIWREILGTGTSEQMHLDEGEHHDKLHEAGKWDEYYNIARSYPHFTTNGCKQSEEAKKKISEAGKNRKPVSEETRKKISVANKGRVHSEESKKKISEAKKNPSEETRKKLSVAKKGVKRAPFSEEHKKNMSVAKKGQVFSEEHRKNMSEAQKLRHKRDKIKKMNNLEKYLTFIHE